MVRTTEVARPTSGDAFRSVALTVAAAAQAVVPSLVMLLGDDTEATERNGTAITPPPFAFAIWGPIFAAGIANAVQQGLPAHRGAAVNRVGGWPLTGAHVLNAAWALAARPDHFATTPVILGSAVACAATAYRRQQREEALGLERLAPASTGLLLGWIGLAAAVNVASVAQRLGVDAQSPTTTATWTATALGVSGAAAFTILRSRHGFLPLAASAGWGLVTTAASAQRPRLARTGALLGALTVLVSAVVRLRRSDPRSSAAVGAP